MKKEPFSKKHPKLNTFFGFLLLLLFLGIGILLTYLIGRGMGIAIKEGIEFLKDTVSKLDAVIIVALITGGVSITGVVLSSIISKILEYKQKRREYLYQKREEPYADFIDVVYKIQESTKSNREYSQKEMISDMMRFSKKLTLWGSNRVIKKWLKFREASNKTLNPPELLFVMEDIMFAMRKDMGLRKLGKGKLLSFFVNDINQFSSSFNNRSNNKD